MKSLFFVLVLAFCIPRTAASAADYSDAPLFAAQPDPVALKKFIKQRPASPLVARAYLLLGLAELKAGHAYEAAMMLAIAQSELPELADFVAVNLGDALAKVGLVHGAARVLAPFLDTYRDSPRSEAALERLSGLWWQSGERQQALYLQEALMSQADAENDDETLVRLLMLRAEWALTVNKQDEALKIYKRVWLSFPQFKESELARTQAQGLAQTLHLAAELSVDERLGYARELSRLGREEEADAELLAILAADVKQLLPERKVIVFLRRAQLSLRRRYPEIALELCATLLKEPYLKTHAELRRDVMRVAAKAHSLLFHFAEACEIYGKLAKESAAKKDRRDAALLYAVLLRDSGRPGEAEAAFQKFIKDYAGDAKVQDARWYWGWMRFRLGDHPGAERQWQTILDKAPQSPLAPRVNYWMGRIADLAGKKSEAIAAYQKVRDDDVWSYYGWLAELRARGERIDNAEAAGSPSTFWMSPLQGYRPSLAQLNDTTLTLTDKALAQTSLLWQLGLHSEASRVLAQAPVPDRDSDVLLLAEMHASLDDYYRSHLLVRSRFARELREPLSPQGHVLFEFAYPKAYYRYVEPAAAKFSVPPELVYAVMRQESTFRAFARSAADAQGLLQLIPATAQKIARTLGEPPPATFIKPEVNIFLGTAYLSKLYESFNHNPALAAAAYNAGPLAVEHWLLRMPDLPFDVFVEEIPFRETRDYVKKVMANFAAYRQIYRGAPTTVAGWLEPLPQASKGLVDF